MPRVLNLDEKVAGLRGFFRRERRLPSYAELLEVFGYRSKNSVAVVLEKLVEAGFLVRDAAGKLAPTKRLTGLVRKLGVIEAGFPSPAEEELRDTLSLDEWLIRRPEATFLLDVKGESMRDAGILPGDVVLVERGANPRNGAVVVACVDGEWTLKHYFKDGDGVRLEPANPKFKTIRPKNRLEIGGVVRSVIRKFE